MQRLNKSNKKSGLLRLRIITMALVAVMLVPILGFGVSAMVGGSGADKDGELSYSVNGFTYFDSEEVVAQLKKELVNSINKDLLMKVDEYELSGPVDVIITFSDDSLVSSFADSGKSDRMTLKDYRLTSEAKKLTAQLESRQSSVLEDLSKKGIIDGVKYQYLNIMDGACVSTTYEKMESLCNAEGVERVMLSNRYEACDAVENPVDVYPTGIFNSSNISFTGKGTIVAILDSGCDYNHTAFTTHTVDSPLYDRDDIAALLDKTMAYSYSHGLEAREVYYGNITGGKIAFGYDYADKDTDIMPFESSHGTHVAGIIGGKDEHITGVAIDTQFAIMKVFSDYEEGADDDDILAALEDSIILGVDAINMSLGASCGFSREVDNQYKNELYDNIEKAGISLVVAASNDYSSAFGSDNGNTNKTDNPDSATIGSPATYDASMSVASINGEKDKYLLANGNKVVFYNDAYDTGSEKYDLFKMLGITAGEKVTYEYVTVPGVGMAVNYAGIDVNGKIALVKRGDITFEEKVQYAQEAGAIAVVIYNNVFGDISMTIGNFARIPAVSIGKDEGDVLAAQPSGTIEFDLANVAGPFMSDFSSWGPTPDLHLKPEITAHGGNIESATVGNEYDKLSGTSMAAPNMCGITVLIRQYVKERYPNMSATDVRDMVNRLTMSTATIALDKNGNPYSPRKQGAGIADILKSTTTPAYLYNEKIGKTKFELGDDPDRLGVYSMTVSIKNISDVAQSYRVGSITMTESISTSEPEYVAEMAYLLSPAANYTAEGGSFENGVLTVAAGESASITVTLTLSEEDKSYLNSTFENGMYVEGFLTFDNVQENGVDLNAPFLAFYGDWGEAPLFDLDYYEVETEAHDNSIDDDDKIKADYYATTPLGSYYYDYILPLGSYLYQMDESLYSAIPATRERAAISYFAESISGIYGVYAGLLRGAKELNIQIVNVSTGEVVWEETEYNCYKSHYAGGPIPYAAKMDVAMANAKTGEVFGHNNEKFEVTLSAKLDWDGEGDNDNDSFSFSFYVDYQPPSVVDATYRTEYDKSKKRDRFYLDLIIYDNHYAMSCRPVILYEEYNEEKQDIERVYSSLGENPIPIYQQERGGTSKVTIEITDYLDLIKKSGMPNGVTVYIDDYALNANACYIPFPETDSEDLEFSEEVADGINLDIGSTCDLSTYFVHKNTADAVNTDYLQTLKWNIKDDDGTVKLDGGRIEAMKQGSAIIMVTSDSWVTPTKVGEEYVNVPIYKSIVVNVSDTVVEDDPLAGANVKIEGIKFTSYNTLFAFNSDIDWSAIGSTGSTNYFGGQNKIEFYPSEQIQLSYQLDPWNLPEDRYELIWSSSNPSVATVDENGIVTAEAEGKARITLQVKVDGKVSLLAARLSVEVKSEFVIENRTLIAYKGKGGDVVIPDDEGIMYIGSFAFSHYNFDNEKEVEKDENGYYDMDDKKTPIGNDTVTSVVIPEGVETVQKYAFYNCNELRDVTLPTTCKNINEYAFCGSELLENVNFDSVKIISDYAFYGCESLTCEEIGGVNLSGVYAMGDYSFAKTRLESVELSTLSRVGVGVFSECARLSEVTLGARTRVLDKMFEKTAVKSIEIFADLVSDSAFSECKKLETVTLKSDVTYVGDSAFYGCTSLESFTAMGAVEQIASYAFYGCSALKSFTLPDCTVALGDGVLGKTGVTSLTFGENTVISAVGISLLEGVGAVSADLTGSASYKLVDGVVYSADGKTLVLVLPSANLTTFTVGADVTAIADGAFSSLSKLTTVNFAANSKLESIGANAFANCTKLSSVTLPENDVSLGDLAFYGTTSLTSIDLSFVTELGDFAFAGSSITSVELPSENVKLGVGVFYDCSALKTVKLGAGAVIGESAFESCSVQTVELGGDTTVGDAAFYGCTSLKTFDFADVVGKIGDFAFASCQSLTAVNAPKVTKLGESAFSDCYALSTFLAPALKVVGDNAFAPTSEEVQFATMLESIDLPLVEYIGETAFYGSIYVKTVNIPAVKKLGYGAFGFCSKLETVTIGADLKALPEMLFYGDTMLTVPDLTHIETIGDGAFYGVNLPEELRLDNVISIGTGVFYEPTEETHLVTVYAPKLVTIGEQAFAGCASLKTITAPKLEEIGMYALAYTAIEEFELSTAFKKMGIAVFEGCESFKAFYTTVNGEKVYDLDLGAMLIKDGVLYRDVKNGYSLVVYPSAKADAEFTVLEGTVKIEFCAVYGNKNLEKVILPASLKNIANFAFAGCEKLETVEFKSYYAPVLEGTLTGELEINPDTQDQYPGFDLLYGYDYFYKKMYQLGAGYYYSNFKDVIGSEAAEGMTAILPDNCKGYDSLLYKVYFTVSETTGGVTAGKYAVDFIDAVNKLPENVDRFDKLLVENAIVAYNALAVHESELAFVSNDIIAKYEAACSSYYVDVVEDKIAHLFDMAKNKYSFELVKSVNESFLALSEADRAKVSNNDTRIAKIAELEDKFGCTLDFTKSYEDYVTEVVEPPCKNEPTDKPDEVLAPWVIILIVVSSVALVAGAAAVVFIIIKKKRV